jgi:hypothetical protein
LWLFRELVEGISLNVYLTAYPVVWTLNGNPSLPGVARGGILLGVWRDTMEVIAHSSGDYHIKLHIRNRADNFTWSLVAVYGAAQDEYKAYFLRELVNLAKDNPYPILIGGDFNLLRFRHEKSKGRFDDH